jgi:putative transposase
MLLSHKIALEPNQRQLAYFRRAAGTARFTWNLALAAWEEAYLADGKVDSFKLERDFNAMKTVQFPWIAEVSARIPNRAFANLRRAYGSFLKKKAEHPKFKNKRRGRDSFYVHNREFKVVGKTLVLCPARGFGPIRMRQKLRFSGEVMGATISREADQWSIAIQVDVGEYRRPRTGDGVVGADLGADLGVKHLVALSTGEFIEGLRPLERALEQLRRLSRRLSRKEKGSNNRRKAALKLAKLHARIAHLRADFLHRLTTRLCRENQAVAIECLGVAEMMQKGGRLARLLGDAGLGEIRRQLGYKGPIFGTRIKVADRWFPSTQTCSECGAVRKVKLTLADRVFVCDMCGYEADRDFNASRNLKNLIPVNCGESTPVERKALARHAGETGLCEAGILVGESYEHKYSTRTVR